MCAPIDGDSEQRIERAGAALKARDRNQAPRVEVGTKARPFDMSPRPWKFSL
jgi:hypothetical protein